MNGTSRLDLIWDAGGLALIPAKLCKDARIGRDRVFAVLVFVADHAGNDDVFAWGVQKTADALSINKRDVDIALAVLDKADLVVPTGDRRGRTAERRVCLSDGGGTAGEKAGIPLGKRRGKGGDTAGDPRHIKGPAPAPAPDPVPEPLDGHGENAVQTGWGESISEKTDANEEEAMTTLTPVDETAVTEPDWTRQARAFRADHRDKFTDWPDTDADLAVMIGNVMDDTGSNFTAMDRVARCDDHDPATPVGEWLFAYLIREHRARYCQCPDTCDLANLPSTAGLPGA